MRLVRVDVEHFACLRSASVELGPGLNVLYGPNDLGKSTLGRAIRAALLLQHTSSHANEFVEWDSDERPFVKLTLQLPDGRFWRIEKRFGAGSGGSSVLKESQDGQTFSTFKKGREVDEEIRTKLAWGIAAPGTKNAPKGLPSSFLATVLLGEQTDVAGVLEQALGDDSDASGRATLTAALAAFAQDPLFKAILDQAQRRVGEAYTGTGRKKTGRTSPFREVADEVKRVKAHFEEVKQRAAQSDAAKRELETRQSELARCDEALEATTARHDASRSARGQLELRRTLEEALAVAQRTLEGEQMQIDALASDEEKLASAKQALEAAKERRTTLEMRRDAVAAQEKAAEEAVRRAKSADAEQARQLRRSELERRVVELDRAANVVETQRAQAAKAKAAGLRVEQLEDELEAMAERRTQSARAAEAAGTEEAEIERRISLAAVAAKVAVLRKTASEIAELEGVRRTVEERRAQAETLQKEAQTLRGQVSAELPSQPAVESLAALWRDLELAEASLGADIAITVERLRDVTLVARVDGEDRAVPPGGRTTFECTRGFELTIGDIARVSVAGGHRDALARAETLRARWASDGAPVLTAAGVADVGALLERVAQSEDLERKGDALVAEAKQLEQEADVRAERLGRLASLVEERGALERELEGTSRKSAELLLDELGARPVDAYRSELDAKKRDAEAARSTATAKLQESETETQVLEERMAGARSALEAVGVSEPASGWERYEAELDHRFVDLAAQVARVRDELSKLESEQNAEVSSAEAALAEVREVFEGLSAELPTVVVSVDELQQEVSRLGGSIEVQRMVVDRLDIAARRAEVERHAERLAEVPPPPSPVTEEELRAAEEAVAAARRACDAARDEVRKAEGALETVGGQVVVEQEEEAQEALRIAEQKERDVEVEFEAWRLLVEKLREAENTEGQHLGEALSQPVSKTFAELTAGRYGKLEIAPDLKADGLHVAGVVRDIRSLSVGTQEQLATLLRLTVAEQLGSTLVLDDHLAQTDPARSEWFRRVLAERASKIQIIVLTCRPLDYLAEDQVPPNGATPIGGSYPVRAIDVARSLERLRPTSR